MFATQGVPVVCLMVGLVFVPESPRWLAAVGRHAEALRVLAKINGRAQAEKELKEIRDELGDETGGFGELFRPGVRLAVIIGIVLMVFSQINGVNMILIYTPTLFLEAGITDRPRRHPQQRLHRRLDHALHGDRLLAHPHLQPPVHLDLRHDRHGRRAPADVPELHATTCRRHSPWRRCWCPRGPSP